MGIHSSLPHSPLSLTPFPGLCSLITLHPSPHLSPSPPRFLHFKTKLNDSQKNNSERDKKKGIANQFGGRTIGPKFRNPDLKGITHFTWTEM